MRFRILTVLVAAFAVACENAGENLGLPDLLQGAIGVGVYLDRDGSLTQSAGDTVFAGARVSLLVAGGTDTIRTATSGADGVAVFNDVPLGSYRVVVDRAALGDSIGVVVGDTGTIRIVAQQPGITATRVVRLGFREVTIGEARAIPAGRRVFVRGIVHSGLQIFRDSSSFMSSNGVSIRITGARHRPGRAFNNPGDSVIVLATTGVRAGQPVLVDGLIATLGVTAAPIPTPITVAEARTAKGGTLDAAFITVVGARIADTVAATPDFLVIIAEVADTSIKTNVLIDAQLNAPRTIFRPGFPITVRGVLVPRGDGTWVIKPRGGTDVTIG